MSDTLVGGAGNDIYYLSYAVTDVANDLVIEAAGGGIDTAYALFSVAALANEVENLTLVGTGAIDATGNASNNTLIGNSAANRLNGGAGSDTLQGGLGNDTFVFGFGQSGISTGVDRILDFAIGSDKIDLFSAPVPNSFARATNSTATTLASVISGVYADPTITLSGGGAALVVSTGVGSAGTYLIIDNGTAGFQSGSDLVVNITGFTGTLPGVGTLTPNSFFV
jgi:Ca2+-binding RTX toxin-like protein